MDLLFLKDPAVCPAHLIEQRKERHRLIQQCQLIVFQQQHIFGAFRHRGKLLVGLIHLRQLRLLPGRIRIERIEIAVQSVQAELQAAKDVHEHMRSADTAAFRLTDMLLQLFLCRINGMEIRVTLLNDLIHVLRTYHEIALADLIAEEPDSKAAPDKVTAFMRIKQEQMPDLGLMLTGSPQDLVIREMLPEKRTVLRMHKAFRKFSTESAELVRAGDSDLILLAEFIMCDDICVGIDLGNKLHGVMDHAVDAAAQHQLFVLGLRHIDLALDLIVNVRDIDHGAEGVLRFLLHIDLCADEPPAVAVFLPVVDRDLMLAEPVVLCSSGRQHGHCDALVVLRMTVRHDDALKELTERTVIRRQNGIVLNAVAMRDLRLIITLRKPKVTVPDDSIELGGQRFLPAFCFELLPLLQVNVLHGIDSLRRPLIAVKGSQRQHGARPFCRLVRIAVRINAAVFDRNFVITDRHQSAESVQCQIIPQRSAVIRMHHADQLIDNILKPIDRVHRKPAAHIRVHGAYDGVTGRQVDMEHQPENIGDAGKNIIIAQGNGFQLLLLQMALVAVLAEQHNDAVSGCGKRKACPAVFVIGHTADIAGLNNILLLKHPELFIGKCIQKRGTVVRMNDRIGIMQKEFIERREMRLRIHQRILIADNSNIPETQVDPQRNKISGIQHSRHQINCFRRRPVCTAVKRQCNGRDAFPFQPDGMKHRTALCKPRLFLRIKPVNTVI